MNRALGYSMLIVREAVSMYRAGMSCKAIARDLKRRYTVSPSYASVNNWVKAAGLSRSVKRSQQLAAMVYHGRDYDRIRAEARRLVLEEALSESAAAEILGVAPATVAAAIPSHLRVVDTSESISRRFWQSNLPDVEDRRRRRDVVIEMRRQRRRYAEIVATTGLSKTTVTKYLHEAGMTKQIARRREAA